jgi:Domain of unknown function (DUF4386)
VAHELQFRVGTAFEIVMFNCDVVLAVALYVLLKPINPAPALLGAFWRLGNAIVSLVGLIFFSLGAGVHSYLLLKSAYIPRILSGLYLFAAVWLLLCCFGFIIAPKSMTMFNAAFIVPDFVAELPVGLWLAFKGANVPLQGD